MMRDYMSHRSQGILKLVDSLVEQERIAHGAKSNREREAAEKKLQDIRNRLRAETPTAAANYELLLAIEGTKSPLARSLRTRWQNAILQERTRRVDGLQPLTRNWKEARSYWSMFAAPTIDLSILPAYSFAIQLTFRLAQPYISRDEQNFYIIDNPVRKDKLFGLPYVASTSWKGSLRSACWHMKYKEDSDKDKQEKATIMLHLFGNEKGAEKPEEFHAGRLQFFPTFFTTKSLEVINPQDREQRAGTDPIVFESVPEGSEGTFTLLYVPFDLIGENDAKPSDQVALDLGLVAKGIKEMFTTYGFGAKTSSGFGLAREDMKGTFSMRIVDRSEQFSSFKQLSIVTDKLSAALMKE